MKITPDILPSRLANPGVDHGRLHRLSGPTILKGAYPVSLSSGAPGMELMLWHARWALNLGWDFNAESEPWLPVGCAGPVMILGHWRGGVFPRGLPASCFQAVVIAEDDYARHHRECLIMHSVALAKVSEEAGVFLQRSGFPDTFILPQGLRAGFQFLLEYFPHEPALRAGLAGLLSKPGLDVASLPSGYLAAAGFLGREYSIVDMRGLRSIEGPEHLAPEALSQAQLVGCRESELWVAVRQVPAPALEDRLLNELGEGWRVHLLQCADARASASSDGAGRSGVQRSLISIDATDSASGQGVASVSLPGEIVISDHDVHALELYDPRRPDRDPGRVFLRELSAAIRAGASDLHLEPGVDRFRIRARVDGLLEEWLETGVDFGQSLVGAAKEMIGMPAERFLPQDASCTVRHGRELIGTRVSSYPIRKRRQKLVLRFLPRRGGVPSLGTLLPPAASRMLLRAAGSPHGLVLVCGPTGSGKTTTVFSALDAINTPYRNITTLEDPVEYELEGLNQAELDPHRGVGWDSLLCGFLRQDPDAGLIGEIRDRETAETAVRQALTGHVVFATLHTMSCARTLERLMDMGVKADVLASALTLVVSQRLVRRLCVSCRRVRSAKAEEILLFQRHGLRAPEHLWEASPGGCPACRQGFHGRVAAVEMLPITSEVAGLIEEKARARHFDDWMKVNRFPSVFEAALRLAMEGATTLDEAAEWQGVWEDFDWEPAQ